MTAVSGRQRVVLDARETDRLLQEMAAAIVDRTGGKSTAEPVGLVGIRRGGVPLASRLAAQIANLGRTAPLGTIDITLYRDDAATALPSPKIGRSEVPFDIEGQHVVLVDDVLQTGRTVRAAIECLLDYGRPRRVWLATLCDRGGRELPIVADFVGMTVSVEPFERLDLAEDGDVLQVVAEEAGA